MKVLSLSSVYPNPDEQGLGLFVGSRLLAVARHSQVKVIAPIPLLDYSHPRRKVFRRRGSPLTRWDGPIEVFHPRWMFPPYGTPANILFLFSRLLPLVSRIRLKFKFELIDAHFCYPEGCVAALLAAAAGVPFTVTLRGSETMFDGYRYRSAAMKATLRRAGAVIAVSDELREFALVRGARPERTRTIPNGIDADVFVLRDSAEMRRRHGLSIHRKLLLSAGELIEAKGHHLVVEALQSMLTRGIDAELLIVGTTARGGPQFERVLRSKVREAGIGDRVRFLGWIDRTGLAELLSAVDLFCLASYTEGWPNVVNEALACGTPVIVTQVGGVSAMVRSAELGSIVPQRDQEALNNAVYAALNHTWDRSMISKWGRSRSWDAVAGEVIETFAHILSSRPQTRRSPSTTMLGSI